MQEKTVGVIESFGSECLACWVCYKDAETFRNIMKKCLSEFISE